MQESKLNVDTQHLQSHRCERPRCESEGGADNKQSVYFIYLVSAVSAGAICFVTLFCPTLVLYLYILLSTFCPYSNQYVNIFSPLRQRNKTLQHPLYTTLVAGSML